MTEVQHRPLARSLEPLPEESLPGYLLRLAYRLGRSPGRVAEVCGIHNGQQGRLAVDHLLSLPEQMAAEFAYTTRLRAAEVDALGLRRFAHLYPALQSGRSAAATAATARRRGALFGSIQDHYSDRWAVNFSSRFCPDCLRGDGSPVQEAYGGAWNLRWHLPVVFACTTHQQLLSSRCPECQGLLNPRAYVGRASLLAMPSSPHRLHPLQCRNHAVARGRQTRPCGARLEESAPYTYRRLPCADHARLLALQTRINQCLVSSPLGTSNGLGPALPTFPDLVDTAQLIKLSWPAARALVPSPALAELIDSHTSPLHTALKSTPSKTHSAFSLLWRAPQDSAECGALLLTAESLHRDAPDAAELHERIRPLAQYAFENAHPGAGRSYFSRSSRSITLARAMARRLHGFYAAGPLEYAHLRVPSRDCHFTAEDVPSHLPQAWYDTYFTDFAAHVPGAGIYTVRHLRRAAALKLVEMAAGGSWRDCARSLGIPESKASSALQKLRGQFGDADLWPRFEDIIEQIARYLDEMPQRTNYANRRRVMSDWTMLYGDWVALCSGLPQADRLTSRHGTVIGTVLVWAEVTQADHLLCPLLQDLRESRTNHRPVIDEISQFFTPVNQRAGRLTLRLRLQRFARELCDRIDAGDALSDPTFVGQPLRPQSDT